MWGSKFSAKSGTTRVLPQIRPSSLMKLFEDDDWKCGYFAQPHFNFFAERDGIVILVGMLDGELNHVPMESIASTSAEHHAPGIVITCCEPQAAINASLLQRNCYLLRRDRISLLPTILELLRAERARQQAVMTSSVGATSEGHKGVVSYTVESVITQLFKALLLRNAESVDFQNLSDFVSTTYRENGIENLASLLVGSDEFRTIMAQRMSDTQSALQTLGVFQ
jgi:hypothetical protein